VFRAPRHSPGPEKHRQGSRFRVQDSGTWQSGTPSGVPPARVSGYDFWAQGSRSKEMGGFNVMLNLIQHLLTLIQLPAMPMHGDPGSSPE